MVIGGGGDPLKREGFPLASVKDGGRDVHLLLVAVVSMSNFVFFKTILTSFYLILCAKHRFSIL